jgi:hypothetical protein
MRPAGVTAGGVCAVQGGAEVKYLCSVLFFYADF